MPTVARPETGRRPEAVRREHRGRRTVQRRVEAPLARVPIASTKLLKERTGISVHSPRVSFLRMKTIIQWHILTRVKGFFYCQ